MICRHCFVKILVIIMALLLSAGCSAVPSGSEEPTTFFTSVTETETMPLVTDDVQDAPSGVLRLWWSKRTSLNPLLDVSESGVAANRLIFQGLFQIGSDQRLLNGLAEEISFDASSLTAVIRLRGDQVFHDGSPVTAADVEACLNFILAKSGNSAYAAGLSAISAVQVLDEHALLLTLNRPDYWLAYRLTFPIIPAASLNGKPFDLIPGTGLFRMDSYDSVQGLTLVRSGGLDKKSALRAIRLIEFDDLNDAMKAFEDDRLDLVDLPAVDYSRYVLRDSLRFGHYYSQEAVILAYNTRQKHLLNDSGRLVWLKRLLAVSELNLSGVSGSSTGTAVQLESYLLDGASYSEDQALANLGGGAWPAGSGQMTILVSLADSQNLFLASTLGEHLERAGISWQLRAESAEGFTSALAAGEYDLALLNVVLPAEPDPAWVFSNSPVPPLTVSELAGDGLPDLGEWLTRLQANAILSSMRDQPDTEVLAKNLYEAAVRSPLSVLLIRSAAVVYGDRVIGQSEPDRYNPYQGIEELWVWSGQSS
ncbi:MAG TPA: hypothetical protein DCM45_06015 [Clostridiales bacterium]|nr:hypothetical protein [Clostridiales bacterium]